MAQTSVMQQAKIEQISTRSADDRVRATGNSGISASQVFPALKRSRRACEGSRSRGRSELEYGFRRLPAYCHVTDRRSTSDSERIVVEKERQATSISRLLETDRLRAEDLHPLRRARGNDRYDR